jgi:hypothetical protein
MIVNRRLAGGQLCIMFKVLDHSLQNAGGPNLQIGKVEDLSRNMHGMYIKG